MPGLGWISPRSAGLCWPQLCPLSPNPALVAKKIGIWLFQIILMQKPWSESTAFSGLEYLAIFAFQCNFCDRGLYLVDIFSLWKIDDRRNSYTIFRSCRNRVCDGHCHCNRKLLLFSHRAIFSFEKKT